MIRHHRTWIDQRRLTRPSEEYRRPTPAEWEEFEGHFVKRKVSLGTCGRAYGTNCHHEHARLRCALIRPDPDQTDRLREIITNLHARITEAEQNHWLGEVEGLKVSLSGAQESSRKWNALPPTTAQCRLASHNQTPLTSRFRQTSYNPSTSNVVGQQQLVETVTSNDQNLWMALGGVT